MTREEKIQQLLNKYSNEKQTNSVLEFSLVHKGEPKPYSRPRFTRFGRGGRGHCYNIRENYMNELKDDFLESMNIEHIAKINELINKHIEYYVYVSGKFFIPIPKSDSIDTTAKKIAGIIRPTVKRGDVDNYMKLILDVLHDVVYDDDKNVIGITAEKYYSTEPRIELNIRIEYKGADNE